MHYVDAVANQLLQVQQHCVDAIAYQIGQMQQHCVDAVAYEAEEGSIHAPDGVIIESAERTHIAQQQALNPEHMVFMLDYDLACQHTQILSWQGTWL